MLMISPFPVVQMWAQLTELEVGGVYHFVNANYTEKAMGATNSQSVAGVAKDNTNKAQLWYVESKGANGYALRNLGYGTYLQGNGQSSRWTLASTTDADNSWIKLETKNSNNTFKGYTYGNYGYAHIDGSSNIVGWETGAASTQWTITKKEMTSAEIEEALNIFTTVPTIQTNLDNLFSDKSCTTLKGAFNENDASFKALPQALQAMVRKVAGNTSWEEANSDNSKAKWDAEYAKKYRVQLYEPYNEPECAAKALGLNAHTNLNNPTGIFANNGDVVYVMVDSEIKAGSSLYLTYHIGHGELGGYANGWELHQGLNVIPVYNNETNFCINYVVHTFDTSNDKKGNKAKARKLSDYDPIKIHIEGGHINGYWNKVGDELYAADNNDTWNYLEARATQKTVTVLGKYITLQFPLLNEHTVDTDGNTNKGLATYFNDLVKIEDCINEWDNVMLWERLLLGVLDKNTINAEAKQSPYSITDSKKVFEYTGEDGEFESDYSDYYNVHGLSYGIPNSYMYGGWAHCGYNFNTMEGIIQNLPTNAGSHWGPGHEIGHQHQALLTVNGLTEVTNNLFANVVLWYYGETTSRYNGTEGALSNVLAQFNAEGTDFFSNNIWAQTIMYYKLFLYYHVLGHNPKFYPHLFEMLRQDPMSGGYNQDGSKCLMHFYKKCCLAAGEDLTEFFRAHGFFEVMDNRLVGDYSNSVYTLTQAQIDAAIAEVKAQAETNGWKENIAVLFITDATGETIQSHKGDDLEKYGETTICAEVGCYANFNSEPSNYTYSISGSTVTMEGTGGVGFAILNDKGELIGFSDKKTFEISAEAVAAIASGKASIVTLNADNTPVAATNVMDTGNTEEKYALLGELLGNAKQLLDLSDETGIKVGYYRASSLTNLQEAYESAKAVYDAQTIAAYTSVYDVLYQEYANLINNDYARVNITEGYAYRLTNKAYSGRSMAVNTENNQMSGIETAESDAQLWYFEAGATPGTYYLKNKATSLYPGDVSTGAVLNADKSDKTTDNGAHAYNLQNMGNGVFALVGKTGLHCSSSQSYNIVGWGTDADATQWYITAEVVDETIEERLKLEETIAKTEALVNEMAEVKIKGSALDLTTCTITSNTPETGHETKYLVDGNPETFFHTNWSGAAISENHNFIIDLGEGNSLEQFAFNYITLPNSANNVDAPEAMVIEGSTNGTDYTSITSLSGLPTTKGTTYTSATLGTKGTAYRYLRFSVTDATGGKLGSYYYFGLAEFGLTNMQTELLSVKDGYSTSQTAILDACDGLYSANLVYNNETATKAELQAAASALNEDYTALLNAYNAVKEVGLEAKKEELQELIDKTTALIGECGEVNYTPAMFDGEAPLQVTDANGKFYLSTNAQSNQEGPISGLVDGVVGNANSSTYFHTDYSGSNSTDGLDHYIQIKLGEKVKAFQFTYTNRYNTDKNYATKMTILGSTDGTTFEEITRLEGLPAQASAVYTSEQINITKEYTHLRFMVTESDNSVKKGGHHFFHMAEFDLTLIGGPETYTVQLNQNIGEVTEDLLLATYKENEEAKSTFNYATTELQVINAIADLQAQYEALEAAKKVVDKSGLIQLIATATEKLAACGTVTPNGDVLDVTLNEQAGSVNKNMLRELYRAIETAQGVINNANATQEEVDAEIAELTAQIEVVQTAKNSTAKADLKTAIDDAQTAIDACASSITKDGDAYTVEWKSETAGDVDKATLIAAYEALVQANAVYNGDASAVSEYQAAKEALNTPIATLNEYKEGYHKAQLKSMVDLLTALIEKCNTEGQGDLTAGMLEEMVQINKIATAYLTQEFATQEVLVSTIDGAISNIETNYPTWSAAQQSTAKKDLLAKIEELQNLIDECRATGTKIITTDVPCALQTTSPNAPFYLSTNAPDSEGVIANLVDGKMNTFFQTKSGVGEEHYLLVDVGDGNALKKFKFSYRTNKSFFPYTIVVYGSNDNTNFIPLATKFSKDDNVNPLPTSADQLWISSEIVSETAYRYLRFNVTELGLALNVDGDKEIDTSKGGQLSNKYRNSLASSNATPSQVVECCFAMSEFDLISRVDEEGVTEDQITPAETAIDDAKELANNSADATELSDMKTTLQTSYDALNAAYLAASQRIQVTLTTTDAKRDELLSGIEFGQTIGTFSAPYATVIPEGVTAYYAEQDYDRGTVSLTPIEEGMALPAEQGVILMGEVGVNTVMFIPATDETKADLNANTFSPSATSSVVMESNDYILANGGQGIGFYHATPGSILKQRKAFFRLLAGAAPLSLVLKFGGNTTDIDFIGTDMDNVDEPIFDVYGRQVTQILKGRVYIKNGKKFIAK